MNERGAQRAMIVTGLSGAGKTTALKTFEDLGWEVVDNLPVGLLARMLAMPGDDGARPLALGIGAATRGFDAARLLATLRDAGGEIEILFLDCPDGELENRFSATRARHPLAADSPAGYGIARDRALLAPLRAAADHLLDTGGLSTHALREELRRRFGEAGEQGTTTIAIRSFAFSRGVPRGADLMFDMRFLRNPHWVPDLRPLTGLDARVGAYVADDPAYAEAMERIEGLLLLLLPRYAAEGKSYVTVAFGCTGGKHRSVHAGERVAARLRDAGFSLTVEHRELERAAGGADGS